MIFRRLVIVACVIAMALSACRHPPDQAQVRAAISASSAAAEAGDPSATVAPLTDDFDGNGGTLDKRALANLLRLLHLRGQSVHVLMGPVTTEPHGERMIARFTVTLTAGAGVLPDDAGAYTVESNWRKDSGEWHCFGATWKREL